MREMIFNEEQNMLSVISPEDGVTDILILTDEKEVKRTDENTNEEKTEYHYNGNSVRVYKNVTEEDVEQDKEYYMSLEQGEKPTEDMESYANEKVDEFTLQLMNEGVL